MSLADCLEDMQGFGVSMGRKGGGLVIQSGAFTMDDATRATLAEHKHLLVSILPPDGHMVAVGMVMDAVGAYMEREAVMLESGAMPDEAKAVALAQAQAVLGA